MRENDVIRKSWDESNWTREIVLPGADPDTFVVIAGARYAKDASTVYHYASPIEGALAASFAPIGHGWFADAKRVYHRSATPLSGADPSTFEALDERWGRDRMTVYLGDDPLVTCDAPSFEVIELYWGKDDECVYASFAPVPGADPDTFELLSPTYGRDARGIYAKSAFDLGPEELARLSAYTRERMAGRKFATLPMARRVEGVDRDSFEVDPDRTTDARDRNRCYRWGEPIDCAELE